MVNPAGFVLGGAARTGEDGKYEILAGGIQGVKHMVFIDSLIAWMTANPGKPITLAARHLGVGVIFARAIAASDAFRNRYEEVRNETLREAGIIPLRDKILVAADMAVERLAERIPEIESTSDLVDVTETLLAQAYGKPQAQAPVAQPPQQVNVTVQAAILAGRSRLLGESGTTETVVERAPSSALPEPGPGSPSPLSAPDPKQERS